MRMLIMAVALVASACSPAGAPTSTTNPPIAQAAIGGTWTVQLDLQTDDGGHSVRTFTYTTTCAGSACTTNGLIETSDATRAVAVAFDGVQHTFGFDRNATYEQDGDVICEWSSTMQYELHVSEAAFVADVWHATALDGTLIEQPTVVSHAEGVDCTMPTFVSSLSAVPQQ